MAGLLDFLNTDEGRLGLGLLSAAGPSMQPIGIGQRLQNGLGYARAQKEQDVLDQIRLGQLAQMTQQGELGKLKLAQEQQQAADKDFYRQAAQDAWSLPKSAATNAINNAVAGGAQAGPTLQAAQALETAQPTHAGFDYAKYANAVAQRDPMQAFDIQQKIQKQNIKLASGEAMFDTAGKKLFENLKDEAPTAIKEYNLSVKQGYPGTFTQWSLEQKRAGSPSTTVSIAGPENQYNKDVGSGLAKSALDVVNSAQGAAETVRNAGLIRNALNSGAITGTGAGARYAVNKALATAGLVGQGGAASTEALMSGLGNVTLSQVKSSGLGAGNGFTDKDREFLESAKSGRIEMTKENILRVADLSERVARYSHAQGSAILKRWGADPALRAVAQDTQIQSLPESGAQQPIVAQKVVTLSDIAATAKASGKTTADVTAALRSKGYTIQGQ
jgi:hypothetical protein